MTRTVTLTVNPSIDLGASTEKVMPTRKLRCSEVKRDPGGGGINVARVITHLGGDCLALHTAGGSPGQLLRRLLQAEAVPAEAVEVTEDTREDFTILETASGEQFRFVLPGPLLTAAELDRFKQRLQVLMQQHRPQFVVASGSLPPGTPPQLYAEIGAIVRARGAQYIVDSSGPALAAALDGNEFLLIKPSLRELRELSAAPLASDSEWRSAAVALVRSGRIRHIAVTLGEGGAVLVGADRILHARAPTVRVASTIGAGDSFLAAMVWRLALGDDIDRAFRYGVAAGTAAVMNEGTAHCRREDVEALFPQVIVSQQ